MIDKYALPTKEKMIAYYTKKINKLDKYISDAIAEKLPPHFAQQWTKERDKIQRDFEHDLACYK